jgi:lipopolysaccharide export system permease protein
MKTYIKYLIKLFSYSFLKVFLIFFSIILVLNILDQSSLFKDFNVHFLFPVFLSFLNTPSIIFEILPFIFLISTQFFFIKLIDSYELEIFKYSGLDNLKIIKILSCLSFALGFFIIIFYYNSSSLMKSSYLKFKDKYTNDNKSLAVITENGLWIKDENEEGIKIVNAKNITETFLNEVLIFRYNENFELIEAIESKKIDVSSTTWRIIEPTLFKDNSQIYFKEMYLNSNFDLKKISSLFSNLSSLTIYELIKLRKTYKSLNYSLIEIDAHLIKISSYPFYLTLITILTSIIMFNIGFRKDTLFKIILGIFLSVTIYYINYFFNALGTSEKIPLMLSIWFPLIILAIINATFILRLNEK